MDSKEIALFRDYEVKGVINIDLLDELISEIADHNYSKLEKFCQFLELRLSDFRAVNCGLKLLDDKRFQSEIHKNNKLIQSFRSRIDIILRDENDW